MEALIDNILDFARGRLGEGIALNTTDNMEALETALKQVINEIKTISPQRKIKVKFDLQKPVHLDITRISQLLSNLLTNADTHGFQEHPIEIFAISINGEFRLNVKNKGEKIPASALPHLFEPFYRENEKPTIKGLGLGLFIAREIAIAHKGEIVVNSAEKETSFEFVMPNGEG